MAVSEDEAIVVSGSVLARALDDVDAVREFILMLVARQRDSDRKRLEFAALDTLGRVAWRPLQLSEQFGQETEDGISARAAGEFTHQSTTSNDRHAVTTN